MTHVGEKQVWRWDQRRTPPRGADLAFEGVGYTQFLAYLEVLFKLRRVVIGGWIEDPNGLSRIS
jgi:hypothetical protein